METFIITLRNKLLENGLPESHADKVMDIAITHENFNHMRSRWYDDTSGYHDIFLPILWGLLKPIALAYIIDICPKAWFRSLFESNKDKSIEITLTE